MLNQTPYLSLIILALITFSGSNAIAETRASDSWTQKREVSMNLTPMTSHSITLYNPSSVDQEVDVIITAIGIEQINNAYVYNKFGQCIYNFSNNSCTYFIPSGTSVSCTADYKNCENRKDQAIYKTIPKNGGILKLGFGSLLNISYCYDGCVSLAGGDPNSGISVTIRVNGNQGYITAQAASFEDVSNYQESRAFNSGRPF